MADCSLNFTRKPTHKPADSATPFHRIDYPVSVCTISIRWQVRPVETRISQARFYARNAQTSSGSKDGIQEFARKKGPSNEGPLEKKQTQLDS
jgi:hypothetical protein